MRSKIQNKRTVRRIKSNKIKLLILFFINFITTALFVGFFVGTSSVLDSIEEFNTDYNAESGMFISEKTTSDGIKTEEIRYVESKYEDKTIRVFTERNKINKYQVTSGCDLEGENEILLDKNFLNENNLSIGNNITLNDTDFKIVGTAISPDYITTKNSELILQANAKKFGIAFVSNSTFANSFSDDLVQKYSAYTSNKSIKDVIKASDPIYIKDSKNNSRMKQVIGDAKAPKELASLIAVIFYSISLVLLLVYHYERAKQEKNNLITLRNLGESNSDIFKQYSLETNLLVLLGWISGSIVGIGALNTVMQMNAKIYNYPNLQVNYRTLYIVLGLALLIPLIFNNIIIYKSYIKSKSKVKNPKTTVIQKKISSSSLFFDFKYRLLKILRNRKEVILFASLIFVVGFLINFSFLLKASVDKYVVDLGIENKFERIYFIEPTTEFSKDNSDEEFQLYSLYDSEEVVQNVYVVQQESSYYDLPVNSGIVISQAYSEKYNVKKGDEITLKDLQNGKSHKLKINEVNNTSTVSEIYITSDLKDKIFDEDQYFVAGLVTTTKHSELEGKSSEITKSEIITSGKNILDVINKQITLIIIISIFVEISLIYSLFEFMIQNNKKSMKILNLNGFSLNQITRMHFLFNNMIVVFVVTISYLLAKIGVRIFLDKIMFTFSNFVEVTNEVKVILIANIIIISIYLFYYYNSKRKIKKLLN